MKGSISIGMLVSLWLFARMLGMEIWLVLHLQHLFDRKADLVLPMRKARTGKIGPIETICPPLSSRCCCPLLEEVR